MTSGHAASVIPTDRMLRQFAGLWIVVFGLLAARRFDDHGDALAIGLGLLAITVGPMGIVWPRAIKPIFVTWMAVATPIGQIVSHVILGVLFYGLFTFVASMFRLIRRDALELQRPSADAPSYWRPAPPARPASHYLRQF